jgi:hypothetical protein
MSRPWDFVDDPDAPHPPTHPGPCGPEAGCDQTCADWAAYCAAKEGCICQGCGRRYRVDFLVPDSIWERIKPDGKPKGAGLLCGACIAGRMEALGQFAAIRVQIEET